MNDSLATVLDLSLNIRDKDAVMKEVKEVFAKHGFTVEFNKNTVDAPLPSPSGVGANTATTTPTTTTTTTIARRPQRSTPISPPDYLASIQQRKNDAFLRSIARETRAEFERDRRAGEEEDRRLRRQQAAAAAVAASSSSSLRTTTATTSNSSNNNATTMIPSSSNNDNSNNSNNPSVSVQEREDSARMVYDLDDEDIDLNDFEETPTTTAATNTSSSSNSNNAATATYHHRHHPVSAQTTIASNSSSNNNKNNNLITISGHLRSKRQRTQQTAHSQPEYDDINTQYSQEDVSSQVVLSDGGSMKNTWRNGGKLVSEIDFICSTHPEHRLKVIDNVHNCLQFLESNNQSLNFDDSASLINARHLEQQQQAAILSRATRSKAKLNLLDSASIAVAMMQIIQNINIVYCHEKTAQSMMAKMKQGVRRYMHLIRVCGPDIALLPLTFNPWNLEEMSEETFLHALNNSNIEVVKRKLRDFRTIDRLVPTVVNRIVQMANNDQHVFQGNNTQCQQQQQLQSSTPVERMDLED
ncbi:hypothetical protein BDB00DRAFT_877605 [Zychaea mexicana]|uniref:uncharacterized protein n=1 Tax=Zychaea mexicana TaxID=64656 RepID=UPI0022FDC1B7|nr:uncharacterized protein BDB00DRAFT_877605 [Zychaea mexicana]KAI9488292.1 hypothetical protein BDB00DRAFT_877605 [Zychaea mexicana]